MLAQPSHDVLDIDDGIVDHDTYRDDQAGQDHRVDGRPAQLEHESGGHQRQRDRNEADERRPPVEQEDDQDDEDQDRTEEEGLRQVVEGDVDERRRTEDRRVDLDPLEARPELVDRRFHTARDVERVRPRELLDDEHDARTVVDDRIAEERLMIEHDVGDAGQRHGRVLVDLDDHALETVR